MGLKVWGVGLGLRASIAQVCRPSATSFETSQGLGFRV